MVQTSELMRLCKYGSYEEITAFVDANPAANLNAQDAEAGRTPIMIAAIRKGLMAIQYLISKGADPQIKDNHGATVIAYAAGSGKVEVMQYLISLGLSQHDLIQSGPLAGFTPLMLAMRHNKSDMIRFLTGLGSPRQVSSEQENQRNTAVSALVSFQNLGIPPKSLPISKKTEPNISKLLMAAQVIQAAEKTPEHPNKKSYHRNK